MAIRLPAMHAEALKLQILDPLKLGYTSRPGAMIRSRARTPRASRFRARPMGTCRSSTPLTGSHLEDEQRGR